MTPITLRLKKFLDWLVETEFWQSIYRVRTPFDTTAKRTLVMRESVWLHLLPTRMPKNWLHFSYHLGLGSTALFLYVVLIITGFMLMLYYRPTISLAYRDMLDFKNDVIPYGMFMRNLHRWTAHGMLIAVWLHMLRVFFSGAYKPPRQFNWVIGVVCLVLTMLLSFTGYLLPWDQLAMWAITVGSNMASYTPFFGYQGPFSLLNQWRDAHFVLLGGTVVGEGALIRFYVLHCVILPIFLSVFLAFHLWRWRKDEFSYPNEITPPPEVQSSMSRFLEWLKEQRRKLQDAKLKPEVFVWPDFCIQLVAIWAVVMVVFVFLSLIFQAPLEEMANPAQTPNPSKAPWYFVGLQEMLVYFDPWIAGVVLPGLIILGLMMVPYLDPTVHGIGTYPLSREPWKKRPIAMGIFTFGFALWIILILIGQFFRGPNWQWYWPWESWAVEKVVAGNIYERMDDWLQCKIAPVEVSREEFDKLEKVRVKKHTSCYGIKGKSSRAHAEQGEEGQVPETYWIAWRKPQFLGWILLFLFYGLGMVLPRFLFPKLYLLLGPVRYSIVFFLLTTEIGLLFKIFLRLFLNVKYLIQTPWFNI
ncbi:MAG: cytochrome b N-terminal domain-containing protein [bacterium JZ-2024 1]